MKNQYDIDYFLTKFSAIPDEQWTVGAGLNEKGPHCVLGLCGVRYSLVELTDEAIALVNILRPYVESSLFYANRPAEPAWLINDGVPDLPYFIKANTPKARILAALADAKARAEAALDEYERRELKPLSPVSPPAKQVNATSEPLPMGRASAHLWAERQA